MELVHNSAFSTTYFMGKVKSLLFSHPSIPSFLPPFLHSFIHSFIYMFDCIWFYWNFEYKQTGRGSFMSCGQRGPGPRPGKQNLNL